MTGARRRALAVALLLLASCKGEARPSSVPTTVPDRPVRIGVWLPPNPSANTYGGAAVRSLVYPQLFRATPDGKWEASLVERGSDVTRKGARSARFRLRPRALWSDGTPITVSDLRRTLDGRFVTAIDDATPSGTVVVRFSQALPGWRRLWSGLAAISPPRDGLFGGPYNIATVTPNLETVLVANPRYYGPRPKIREVRLVLVPDPEIQARLMDKGELDVIAPPAFTDRTRRLRRIDSTRVLIGDAQRGGWTAALVANPSRLPLAQRMSLFSLVDTDRFARVLLRGEATPSRRGVSPSGPTPPTSSVPAIASPLESAPGDLLLHAMQRTGYKAGISFDLRPAEFDRVLDAYAAGAYDALFRFEPSAPEICWTCSYAGIDAEMAKRADAGDRSAISTLNRRLVVEGLERPLWRERPVAAVRDGLAGVSLNGFHVAGPAWNIETWRWVR